MLESGSHTFFIIQKDSNPSQIQKKIQITDSSQIHHRFKKRFKSVTVNVCIVLGLVRSHEGETVDAYLLSAGAVTSMVLMG